MDNPIEVRLECDCGDPWHMVVIRYYQTTEWMGKNGKKIEDIPDLIFIGKMCNGGLWERIKNAIKHIIRGGYESEMNVSLLGEGTESNLDKLYAFSGICLDIEKTRKERK